MPRRRQAAPKPKGKRGKVVSAKGTSTLEPKPAQSKFDPKYTRIAAKLAEHGAIDREIADAFGVDECTFHRWKIAHPEFAKSLKLGKEIPDERVKRSLYNRAVGYSFDSEELFVDRFGTEHRMKTVKHLPPDTVACIFWQKNRDPENWRDRQEHFHELVTTPEMLRQARARAESVKLPSAVVAEQGERAA